MAALVRQDAPVATVASRPAAEIRADAGEIARLYDAFDGLSERDNLAAGLVLVRIVQLATGGA